MIAGCVPQTNNKLKSKQGTRQFPMETNPEKILAEELKTEAAEGIGLGKRPKVIVEGYWLANGGMVQ